MNEEQLQKIVDDLSGEIVDKNTYIKELEEKVEELKDQVNEIEYDFREIYNIAKKC
jgi:polyhydroxyalkanoate synthesis regulator phasin